MPLERAAPHPIIEPDSSAVSFSMHDPVKDRAVKVTVSQEALLSAGATNNLLEFLDVYRPTIEQAASRKFDRSEGGQFIHLLEEDLQKRP